LNQDFIPFLFLVFSGPELLQPIFPKWNQSFIPYLNHVFLPYLKQVFLPYMNKVSPSLLEPGLSSLLEPCIPCERVTERTSNEGLKKGKKRGHSHP
jgi:hypothetical protein